MTQKDVYALYQEIIKPLYCEIEAQGNQLPVELLFEIHAAFDHLKRFYLDGMTEDECCHKAVSHLKRGALDAFKLKLKYFNQATETLLSCGADLDLIDNGSFLVNLTADRAEIQNLAKKARMSEGNHDKGTAFDPWYETSLKIDQFRDTYLNRHHAVTWARRKTFNWLTKNLILSAIIGFLTGVASSWLVWHFTKT